MTYQVNDTIVTNIEDENIAVNEAINFADANLTEGFVFENTTRNNEGGWSFDVTWK